MFQKEGDWKWLKAANVKVQQPDDTDDFIDEPDYIWTPPPPPEKEMLPNLINSKTFEEHYINATDPNRQWKNWNTEGVLMTVSTDKPVYRPGDKVEIRTYFFNYTNKAPVSCSEFYPGLEIIDSKDEAIYKKPFDYQNK